MIQISFPEKVLGAEFAGVTGVGGSIAFMELSFLHPALIMERHQQSKKKLFHKNKFDKLVHDYNLLL